jgi:NAD/NADP transhydrogenase beta subunit
VTFTGSVIAYGKLAGKVDGKAKKLPGGHLLNAAAAICRWCCWWSIADRRLVAGADRDDAGRASSSAIT